MAHEIVTWRLHKKGVVLVIVGMLFFTVFIFAAGYLTAVLRTASAAKVPAKPAPVVAVPKTVTTTQASAATGGLKPVPHHQEPLALQVAIFPSEEEAGEFVKTLATKKLEGSIVAMPTREGPVLYGVEVGEYTTRREALAAADVMERKYGLVPTVVPASKHQIDHSPNP